MKKCIYSIYTYLRTNFYMKSLQSFIFSKLARLFTRLKFPGIDKSYVPGMALLATWSLNSCGIPIRSGSTEGQFALPQNFRQKISYYLSFSAYQFYVSAFNFWFYKNFYGQSRQVWEDLVQICFFISVNILGVFQITCYFRKNEMKQLLENSFWMEKRCLTMGNLGLCTCFRS